MNPIAIRLLNQQLAAPQYSDPAEVVNYMGAMQAQEYRMMRWAVAMRTRPLSTMALTYGRTCSRSAELEQAPLRSRSIAAFKRAFNSGRIIRLHLMRGTWQLVSAEDYWMMIGLCAPKAIAVTKGWMSSNKITIPDKELMHIRDILAQKAADLGSATKEDFVHALAEKNIKMDDHRLSYHIRMAEMSGILCSGDLLPLKSACKPDQCGACSDAAERKQLRTSLKATYALTANKVKPMAQMDRDEALLHFTRKYFRSRQPATLEDFVWWSGLNISDCRKGIALMGDTIHVEKWKGRELHSASPLTLGHRQANLQGSRSFTEFYLTDECRTRGFRKGKFLLIPPYDEYLISYKSRDIVLPPEHRHHAHNNSGIFQPVIAYDGTICGNWSPYRDDCQATFFTSSFSQQDISEAWQAYKDYRDK